MSYTNDIYGRREQASDRALGNEYVAHFLQNAISEGILFELLDEHPSLDEAEKERLREMVQSIALALIAECESRRQDSWDDYKRLTESE